MISGELYNNIGIEATAIYSVLQSMQTLPASKSLLILPITTHKELLNYLANGNVKIYSLEKILIEKTGFFSNFNKRFYDNLCRSVNALQLLSEIDFIDFKDGAASIKTNTNLPNSIGTRAKKIIKASSNIAKILEEPLEKLYLNLRIEL